MNTINAFTVDLEDWYQGIGINMSEWNKYEKRIRIGHDRLLSLLSKHKVKATYFVLGKVIEEHPDIIKEIIDEGHEISCHSYSHPFLYDITPEQFTHELDKCIELIKPFGVNYKGFRAPYFSIDHRNLWALDIIKQKGFEYDSSIYPGDNKRTGIKGYNKNIHLLDNQLYEVPVCTFKFLIFEPALGGAYFRILPYNIFKKKFREISQLRPVIFYIHPWEFDLDHPYLSKLPPRIRYPHYYGLKYTEPKMQKLLNDFEFKPLFNIIKELNFESYER
ncbi:MAG: polysaccharide deacetylase family protein [Cytophagaceae bacterium]|nr:polysaccharide deacetylase family protein [Cytophagaceae bacterium]MDW8456910.1 polysaccharide deacetylase family protein [Cytophagaceae bacterium]